MATVIACTNNLLKKTGTMPTDQRMVFYQGPNSSKPQDAESSNPQRAAESGNPQRPTERRPASTQQWVRFKEYQPKPRPSKKKARAKEDDEEAQPSRLPPESRQAIATSQQLTRRQQPVDPTTNQHLLVLPKLLSANDPDPFNVLPAKTDPYAARMLQLYIDPKMLTALFSRSTPEVSRLWLEQRKQQLLPLAMSNTAAFNALIVFMESCPGMPVVDTISQRRRLAMTYQALNEDLKHPERQASDATAFAVVLLMNASEHMSDFDAFRSHTHGLEALVARRRSLPPSVLPKSRPDMSYVSDNLEALRRRNIARPALIDHLRYWHAAAMTWRVVGRDDLLLGLSSSHMMTTGLCFGGALLPMEAVFSESLKLNAARMFRNKTPAADTGFRLQPCIQYIRARLVESDIPHLLQVAPDIILWVCMVVGPVSQEEDSTNYFAALLRRVVRVLGDISYADAHRVVGAQAFLPTPFDDLSRHFWGHFVETIQSDPSSTPDLVSDDGS